MSKLTSIKDAMAERLIIDNCAPGRPVAYKGPRFAPTKLIECYTELESKMLRALELADGIMDYCAGDSWERECTAEARKEYLELYEEITQN